MILGKTGQYKPYSLYSTYIVFNAVNAIRYDMTIHDYGCLPLRHICSKISKLGLGDHSAQHTTQHKSIASPHYYSITIISCTEYPHHLVISH